MKVSWPGSAVPIRSPHERHLRISWPPTSLIAFGSLLLLIATVSVHDAALVALNHDVILDVETNPVGRWLIQANNENVWLFIIVKLFCTSIVCAVLASIYESSRRIGFAVVVPLAAFQAALLSYLCLN